MAAGFTEGRVVRVLIILASLGIMAGCQTANETSASLTDAYYGQAVQRFMDRNPNFTPVSAKDLGKGQRRFVFSSQPVLVTTTLPAYTPTARSYNNAALGNAFNNLNAAVNTVPAVSRSSIQQCNAFVDAVHTGIGNSPVNWEIRSITLGGSC